MGLLVILVILVLFIMGACIGTYGAGLQMEEKKRRRKLGYTYDLRKTWFGSSYYAGPWRPMTQNELDWRDAKLYRDELGKQKAKADAEAAHQEWLAEVKEDAAKWRAIKADELEKAEAATRKSKGRIW